MSKYAISFVQYYTYEVEAENEEEAFDDAHSLFVSEMRQPIAHTNYDDCEVYELD